MGTGHCVMVRSKHQTGWEQGTVLWFGANTRQDGNRALCYGSEQTPDRMGTGHCVMVRRKHQTGWEQGTVLWFGANTRQDGNRALCYGSEQTPDRMGSDCSEGSKGSRNMAGAPMPCFCCPYCLHCRN